MLLEDLQNAEEFDPQQVQIFCDLDGVLADFEAGMTKALQLVFGPDMVHDEHKYETDPEYRKKMWKALEKYQVDHGGEMWYDLDPMHDAKQLWSFISQYPVEILSATGMPKHKAAEQKHRWVPENIDPNVKINLTSKAAEKAQYAGPNRILIDDKEKAIKPWEAAGGIGVIHTSAADTIAKLKKLGL